MKNILVLTYYYFPDLSAGSFRNTAFVKELSKQLGKDGIIHVITTQPNRYKSFRDKALEVEEFGNNVKIHRISVPEHKSGFKDQITSYLVYYRAALALIKNKKFDLVYASSSRLFTAYLGKKIAKKQGCSLFLDIRDIFVETMIEVLKHNTVIKWIILKAIEQVIERPTFRSAVHINLVSKGFEDYFRKITSCPLSFYPNGIDDAFLGLKATSENNGKIKIITYAGNIGEGQGLEKIIPECAKRLEGSFHFKIIGDGGTKNLLEDAIHSNRLTNVEMINPVRRAELIEIYKKSDFLFLHLNNYRAFERVLPSKIFEYGATDLPMIAGVGGYAKHFIIENVPNSFIFKPGDHEALICWLQHYDYQLVVRKSFLNRFTRDTISKELVQCVLNYL